MKCTMKAKGPNCVIFSVFTIVHLATYFYKAIVIRFLIDILLLFNCIMYSNGGPLEKQRQLKSQPSLKILKNNNNNSK